LWAYVHSICAKKNIAVNTRQKNAVTSPMLLRSASVRLKSALKNFIMA